MRTETAAEAKGGQYSNMHRHSVPADGTRTRRLFDLFMANKGIPLDVSPTTFEGSRSNGYMLAQLSDIYGLDIRKITSRKWVLAGEWFGREYKDYIAERIAEHDAK